MLLDVSLRLSIVRVPGCSGYSIHFEKAERPIALAVRWSKMHR